MMKDNEYGFDSKEFFMIVIIVCLILVMIVPVVINFMEYSNEKVMINNVASFRNAVDRTLFAYANEGKTVENGCYYIMADGNVCLGNYDSSISECSDDNLVIELSGEKPKAGSLDITNNKVSNVYNVRIRNLFVNIDGKLKYYVSEQPQAQTFCRP